MKASIEHATNKLKASPLRYLAVIDSDGFLVGSLSAADLERAA
jgi:CBS-domain-containing membrane protein